MPWSGCSQLCIVIRGPTFKEAYQQISDASQVADLVELRLDYFADFNLSELKKLRNFFEIPMIFTLRDVSQGGNFCEPEGERQIKLLQLAELKPDFLDLEYHLPSTFVQKISHQYPHTRLILSYHHFEKTPDLEQVFKMMNMTSADFYKLAVAAENSLDTLRLFTWMQEEQKKLIKPLIAISMGQNGQPSRILGPIFGSRISYAPYWDAQSTAPGQLDAKTLLDQYAFASINPHTKIYGLIGDPVDKSISDVTHNDLIQKLGWKAVYVKWRVQKEELQEFLNLSRSLPIQGLSVTMPLKETILPYLDSIDPDAEAIGAVNTLQFQSGKIRGYNTDAYGAIHALEKFGSVSGKKIVLLGAGGASKAIAYRALKKGAQVIILNRDLSRAAQLAHRLNCRYGELEEMPLLCLEGYDILINCTPVAMPIDPSTILPNTIAMDIKTKPKDTEFLKQAKLRNCRLVYGYQMFVAQAIGQWELWKENLNDSQAEEILTQKALSVLKPSQKG